MYLIERTESEDSTKRNLDSYLFSGILWPLG